MAKSNIYTRTGDAGTTSLAGGERVNKNSVRLESYGTIDELSSSVGVVIASASGYENVRRQLIKVQNKLFNIGGYLATNVLPGETPAVWGVSEEDIETMEKDIDLFDSEIPKVRAFVLPGGSLLSAYAHMARTVCRRAERRILDLATESFVDPLLITYINRLSDYLFVLARYFNFKEGVSEIVWDKDA